MPKLFAAVPPRRARRVRNGARALPSTRPCSLFSITTRTTCERADCAPGGTMGVVGWAGSSARLRVAASAATPRGRRIARVERAEARDERPALGRAEPRVAVDELVLRG